MTAKISNRPRRLSVWALIFALLFSASLLSTLCLPAHAAPILDKAEQGAEQIGDQVGDVARDATNGVKNAVRDAADGMERADGHVNDHDGKIGNENTPEAEQGMGKVGQVALLVVIAAVIIAIIMIVVLVPKRKKQ